MSVRSLVWFLLLAGASAAALLWYRGRPQAVALVAPEPRDVVELVVATGRLPAPPPRDRGADGGGGPAAVTVREGDRVSEGQVLVELRADEAQVALAEAECALAVAERSLAVARRPAQPEELARARAEHAVATAQREQAAADVARARTLARQGAAAEEELARLERELIAAQAREDGLGAALGLLQRRPLAEDVALAEAQVAQARAGQARAQLRRAWHTVRAPFAGLVVARAIEPGAAVTPGQWLLRCADLRHMEVYLETDEVNLRRLAEGQSATVVAPPFRQQPVAARVVRIGPAVDRARGVVPVRLLPATVPPFPLDVTVDVSIEVGRLTQAWTLPESAVLADERGSFVLMPVAGVATRRAVTERARGGGRVAVDGLEPGQEVLRDAVQIPAGAAVTGR